MMVRKVRTQVIATCASSCPSRIGIRRICTRTDPVSLDLTWRPRITTPSDLRTREWLVSSVIIITTHNLLMWPTLAWLLPFRSVLQRYPPGYEIPALVPSWDWNTGQKTLTKLHLPRVLAYAGNDAIVGQYFDGNIGLSIPGYDYPSIHSGLRTGHQLTCPLTQVYISL